VRFLSNLAFGNDANKAAIMKAGAIPPLVQLLRSGSNECRVYAATALSHLMGAVASEEGPQFCNVADRVAAAIVAAGAIPLLVELLRSDSDEGKTESARALQLLFSNGATNKKVIVAAGALPLLVELLQGRLYEGRKNAAFALYCLGELPGQ
jgi:vacuolar protein 8